MIKRPLNSRFSEAVRIGMKFTTIRDRAWPVGIPIMLYNWSGKPYRSPQIDVCAVEVEDAVDIVISRFAAGMLYQPARQIVAVSLWQAEGFDSEEDMDQWFLAKTREGSSCVKALMRFRVIGGAP